MRSVPLPRYCANAACPAYLAQLPGDWCPTCGQPAAVARPNVVSGAGAPTRAAQPQFGMSLDRCRHGDCQRKAVPGTRFCDRHSE